ncbi:hypothetical protein BBBGCB_BBBGCB_11455, partial [Dysosmobacter welbionis]
PMAMPVIKCRTPCSVIRRSISCRSSSFSCTQLGWLSSVPQGRDFGRCPVKQQVFSISIGSPCYPLLIVLIILYRGCFSTNINDVYIRLSRLNYPYQGRKGGEELKKQLNVEIGGRIRKTREALGYSREALAEKADLATSFIGTIELGTGSFTAESLIKLCHALGTSADYILFGA